MPAAARQALHSAILATMLAAAGCARRSEAPGDPPLPVLKTGPAGAPAASAGPIDTIGLPRIRFARGTTSGILDDSLRAGQTRDYVLGAELGQVMLAHAIAWPVAEREHPPADPTVRVYEASSGRELTGPRAAADLWWGRLPATGDYVVRVTAGERATYTLSVQIPRRLVVDRVKPTAAIAGVAPSRAPVDYLVRGEMGRTLEASLGGAPSAVLHVYGLEDGVQLARLSDRQRLYAARLPTTQDYVVSVVPSDERAAYDLRVTLR
jgi:hypothetical protein